ncbi:ABC transporter ATP-binding protein [Sediminispirochaeta smaragdinae]|jgi:lipoprotein-releasing system ATP-binding protein|uniref:ABC transporter related protein n=1 Tax=Sediminispirochaeta smaragdinae (strain DSM 11293 / JCM 15392 / SEBR 4228) TaxID=573413 RepID=E1R1A9_SEDSS|nr:ABC transporter ATP-binding protein [Sediminispirochaeta smaragdinae]ADK81050.1 ABC transporter related protein [Sediminispirochaeta smaragdinae DSM 11293]
MNALVKVSGLKKVYKSGRELLTVFQDVSFELGEKRFVTLTGESGSGKSTLLHIIGGLDLPSEGRVEVGGERISEMSEQDLTNYRNQVIGFVFQFHYLLKEFTAVENVMLPAYMSGTPRLRARKWAEELIELVGLGNRREHYPSQLSGGEQQRVAVARALINHPSLILADEPTGNLDEKNSIIVTELLARIVREQGTTLLLVTHNPELAAMGEVRLALGGGALSIEEGRA